MNETTTTQQLAALIAAVASSSGLFNVVIVGAPDGGLVVECRWCLRADPERLSVLRAAIPKEEVEHGKTDAALLKVVTNAVDFLQKESSALLLAATQAANAGSGVGQHVQQIDLRDPVELH